MRILDSSKKRVFVPIVLWIPRTIGITCLLFLIALFTASIIGKTYGYYHQHSDSQCYHYSHYLELPWFAQWLVGAFYRTIINIEALWTAIASLVGMIALWGIYEQIRIGLLSVRETKRSVDILYESERGCLALVAMKPINDVTHLYKLGFTFANIGRGHLKLKYLTFEPTDSYSYGPKIQVKWGTNNELMVDLSAGRQLSSIPLNEPYASTTNLIDISKWISRPSTSPKEIAIHFRWSYLTLLGKEYNECITAIYIIKEQGFRIDTERDLKYTDVPLSAS